MDIYDISPILFFLVATLYIWWFYIIRNNGYIKSIYFIYYFFNFCVFFGPIFYYRLGFDGYAYYISYHSLFIYYFIAILVALINMVTFSLTTKVDATIFSKFLSKISYAKIKNHKFLTHYFIVINLICLGYILIFRQHFPLVKLFEEGEVGERLDTVGGVPFYIAFSSLFMVVIPSSFLYFRQRIKNKFIIFSLFVFTLFVLSIGGNKGIVSYFLIFYLLLSNKNQSFLKYVILFLSLSIIYLVFKGFTEFNSETLAYLIESPFRRLFAAQGSGFIVRIDMLSNNLFLDGYEIKQQVYSRIYASDLGTGASPTHFLGDLIVNHGYFLSSVVYVLYVIIFTKLLYTVSKIYNDDTESSFIVWNFFIIAFITTNADITISNSLRTIIVLINLSIISNVSKIKAKV